MNIKKRIAAFLCAAALTLPYMPVNAAESGTYLHGDMNLDGMLNITDLILMKEAVLTYFTDYIDTDIILYTADMNNDLVLDAADYMVLYEYELGIINELPYPQFEYTENEQPDDTESKLIPSSVADANSSAQSTGNARALIFYAEFNDASFKSDKLSGEELKEEFFGNGKTEFPQDSISAYLERSSYGNFHVDGDVYYCKLNSNLSDYYTDDGREKLVMDLLGFFDEKIDYSDYDADNDGDIDILSFTVPLDNASDSEKEFWYGATHTWYHNGYYSVDGVRVKKYIGNDVMPYWDNMAYLKQTFLHELGHAMGLPDFYKYASSDWEGLKGNAGFCRMDDSIGDFCTFSKLMLGWLRENEVQVYNPDESSHEFILKDASKTGSCIILPVDKWDGTYNQEYFMIEYVSDTENNSEVKNWSTNWWDKNAMNGVRVFHIKADMYTDYWGRKDFKYDNYSEKYNGDDKERVIRLVNDETKGFYKTGDIIDDSTAGFHSYDSNGYETVNTGYTIKIGELTKEGYNIEVIRQ